MHKSYLNPRLIFTVVCLLVSIAYLYSASGFSVGEMRRPGVGFVPLVIGTVAVLFSLIELAKCFVAIKVDSKSLPKNGQGLKLLSFFGVAMLYVGIVFYAGYQIATFAMLILLVKLFGEKTWVKPVIFSALFAYGSYKLFTDLLLVPLP